MSLGLCGDKGFEEGITLHVSCLILKLPRRFSVVHTIMHTTIGGIHMTKTDSGDQSNDKGLNQINPASLYMSGLEGLIAATRCYISEEQGDSHATVRRLAEDFAYIHLHDVWNPYRFLRQMEGDPPNRLGTQGFRRELIDDRNPARHYIAFVALGFWLPYWMAFVMLYGWEVAGYVRYGFQWSHEDMQSGLTGLRHGNAVRRSGVEVLPELMARDLAADADLRDPFSFTG
jgi:hypothetical protein